MDWNVLLSTFGLVFVAELGDKTQLAVVTQTCKYRRPWAVFLGASLATTTRKDEAMLHLDRSLELMKPDPSVVSRIYSEQGNIMRLESVRSCLPLLQPGLGGRYHQPGAHLFHGLHTG